MVVKNKRALDQEEETLLIEMVSKQGVHGSILNKPEVTDPDTVAYQPDPPPEIAPQSIRVENEPPPKPIPPPIPAETETRRRRVLLPPHDNLLREGAIVRRRNAIYVSDTTHKALQTVLSKLTDNSVSMSAYVENIIIQHFEHYRDEINERHRQLINDNIL